MRLLLFIDWFLPGYKAGGQISSCANIIHALKDEPIAIYVITRDRDLNGVEAYPGIRVDEWNVLQGNTKVMYLSPGRIAAGTIRSLVKEVNPDTIYFNSMFSPRFTLMPLWVIRKMKVNSKLVLAPRGMLQNGALGFKTTKKKAVLSLLYYTGLLKRVLFHATDETELEDIKKNIPGTPQVQLVYDFPNLQQPAFSEIEKQAGELKCVFISRVAPKKNLLYLLESLAATSSRVLLTIVGPAEDELYWQQCLKVIDRLPSNCTVEYKGAVPNNELGAYYRNHHLFVLPTLGENFGHVIFDSFLNGRPVLISDQTPWRNLRELKAGLDIDLGDKAAFPAGIEYFAGMGAHEFNDWSQHAWLFAQKRIDQLKGLAGEYKLLFN